MERLKTLRVMVWVLMALLVIEIVVLIFMVKPTSPPVWMAIGVITVSSAYLVRISLGVISELINKEQNNK